MGTVLFIVLQEIQSATFIISTNHDTISQIHPGQETLDGKHVKYSLQKQTNMVQRTREIHIVGREPGDTVGRNHVKCAKGFSQTRSIRDRNAPVISNTKCTKDTIIATILGKVLSLKSMVLGEEATWRR